jgi:hypothetical protein
MLHNTIGCLPNTDGLIGLEAAPSLSFQALNGCLYSTKFHANWRSVRKAHFA